MCSSLIYLAESCYTNEFGKIADVLGAGITAGIFIGTVVGVLLLFVRKFNS